MNEHDGEPVRGLPARLPAGERILWQGSPCWPTLARRALHADKIAVYVGLMLAWRAWTDLAAGTGLGATLTLAPLAALGVAIPIALAWLSARATVYTITDRRVVLRFGIALPMTLNLPLRKISSAALRVHRNGTGDIPLSLTEVDRISYILLWPHVRRWRFSRPEPMLRSIPEAADVAKILVRALSDASGQPIPTSIQPASPPEPRRAAMAAAA